MWNATAGRVLSVLGDHAPPLRKDEQINLPVLAQIQLLKFRPLTYKSAVWMHKGIKNVIHAGGLFGSMGTVQEDKPHCDPIPFARIPAIHGDWILHSSDARLPCC